MMHFITRIGAVSILLQVGYIMPMLDKLFWNNNMTFCNFSTYIISDYKW